MLGRPAPAALKQALAQRPAWPADVEAAVRSWAGSAGGGSAAGGTGGDAGAALGETSFEVAALLATLGRDATLEELVQASGLDEGRVIDAIDAAIRAGTLAEGEGASRIRLADRRLGRLVRDRLEPGRRRLLHGRIAAGLATVHGAAGGAAIEIEEHAHRAGERELERASREAAAAALAGLGETERAARVRARG
jgi:hypothetical protein